MKQVLTLLEIITIIAWFGAIIIATTGENINAVVGIIACLSGLWVIVAGLLAYVSSKKRM